MVLIQHHEKYLEIHGEDKIVIMDKAEHMRLHRRLRKEGKCNIPPAELSKISSKARYRSPNAKKYYEQYKKSIKRAYNYKQRKSPCNALLFSESLDSNVKLHERIVYDSITGDVFYIGILRTSNGKKILEL